jgi:phage repressor protein C with HTH and peptisase S24 domain
MNAMNIAALNSQVNSRAMFSFAYHLPMNRQALLRRLIEERFHNSQAEFAKAIGRSPAQVSQWLSGHRAIGDGGARIIETALSLPGFFDLPAGAAMPPERGNLSRTARPIVAFDDDDPLDEDMVSVPSLALKLSAGSGRLEWEVDHTGKPNRYRKDWIARRGLNPSKLVKVKVTGDSMEPGIPDGASLTLDTSSTSLRTGKRHAIDYLGEFFIKRLFRQPDGSVLVRSDNPNKERHPDWTITHEHGDAIRILGSVVEISIDTDD